MTKTKRDSKPKASKRTISEEPSSTSSATNADVAKAVSPAPKTKKRGLDSHAAPSKQGTTAYQTPQKKSRGVKQVTPGTPPAVSTKEPIKKEYVPTYIHKNVEYLRKGSAKLDKRTLEVFELVQKYYVVPDDFEQSRSYGPLSGTCFEERVISAYSLNLLESRNSDEHNATAIKICTHCANEGHKRDQCVELI